jgi:hypothetical protein
MKTPRPLRAASAAMLLLAIVGIAASAAAQDPVVKPSSDPLLTARLPAPAPTARQGQDGRITVTWAPVSGAASYRLWRSVPPGGQTAIALPNPQEPGYVDSDVKAGSTYYYLVSAVNEAGVEGLRAGTAPVAATMSVGAGVLSARIIQQDPPRVALSFSPVSGAAGYQLRRVVFLPLPTDPNSPDFSRPLDQLSRDLPASPTAAEDALPSSTSRRWVRYSLTALGIGTELSSTMLPIPPSASSTGGTTTGGTTTTTSTTISPVGSTTLMVATPATVATGATASLTATVGGTARWLSLNDSIATVDASGTVTGRAAGQTQIVALSSTTDGSLRVVAIPLAVKP